MLVPLALVAFSSSPIDQSVSGDLAGVLKFFSMPTEPRLVNYEFVESAANVVLFSPLGHAAALACAEKRWWQIGILGTPVSGGIELGQLRFIQKRFASAQDHVTNTTGAVIGALLAVAALKRPGQALCGGHAAAVAAGTS
ncbi:VanZ family protein [Arthrobacter sp. D1-29]